ncbi:MAG: CBS domain-containing protein [Bacteroidales bacterium]|nr:CBS domain-containing protein [Lentimicrobiaceae bacterium]MDD5693688.1 CBS domain-containing protein [Bacteroidales bacterium]
MNMIAKDLIAESLHPLDIRDTGTSAMVLMDEYKVWHLPVTDKETFLGLVTEPDLYALDDPDCTLDKLKTSFQRTFVNDYDHIFDVIKLADSMHISVIPVLNEKEEYLGMITLEKLLGGFAKMSCTDFPGSIIILELNVNDYLLSEIAQIVESNDAKILGIYLTSHSESTKLDVTLKINQTNIRSILQTFNRYNYIVKASFSPKDLNEDLRDRYDSLMKYLNI